MAFEDFFFVATHFEPCSACPELFFIKPLLSCLLVDKVWSSFPQVVHNFAPVESPVNLMNIGLLRSNVTGASDVS